MTTQIITLDPDTLIPGEVVITTSEYRRGQRAAHDDFGRGSSGPNHDLLDRLAATQPEFVAGYRSEWADYISPAIRFTPTR